MTTHSLPVPPTLSGPQRLCHQLLMLCLTADLSPAADGNMPEITPADKAEISETVCRYSSLQLIERPGGKCGLEGPTLSRRLCLVHTLHQALRLCPESVRDYFTPALRRILQAQNVPRALYDDCNLNALIALCARSLGRQFSAGDAHYLRLAFQYALAQQTAPSAPEFDDPQRRWIEASEEAPTANLIFRLWQRRAIAPLHHHECLFISLLLRRLCIPDPLRDSQPHAQRLHRAILRLTNQFQSLVLPTVQN
ncbi:hypothetical protein QNH14_04700 [Apirhabdus apintestini]|nr:hypothetical protein QNH14_04700 [Enterobacteriaceae bacterium CA-0114]